MREHLRIRDHCVDITKNPCETRNLPLRHLMLFADLIAKRSR